MCEMFVELAHAQHLALKFSVNKQVQPFVFCVLKQVFELNLTLFKEICKHLLNNVIISLLLLSHHFDEASPYWW